jgi:ribosomal protein S18 acetylase RimI-like enzyme
MKYNDLDKFEQKLFKRLFEYYGNEIEKDRINVFENEKYNEDNRIQLYQTPFNTIIYAASPIYKNLKEKLKNEDLSSKISLEKLKEITDYKEIADEDSTICLYLNPKQHLEVKPPTGFNVQELKEKHKKQFEDFKTDCSEADLSEGQISFADPIVVGCFDQDKIIGAASYWFWGQGLSDIGIVVHPSYRKLGVARALLSKLTGLGIELDRFNIYRHNQKNVASQNLAHSLNFQYMMTIKPIRVLDI